MGKVLYVGRKGEMFIAFAFVTKVSGGARLGCFSPLRVHKEY